TRDVCETCHPAKTGMGADLVRAVIPPPNIKFDHAVHVKRGVACTRCHVALDRIDLATRNQLPTMSTCLSCHDSKRGGLHAPSRCATCHTMRADNTVETQYASGTLTPSGALRGDAHTLAFRTCHVSVADTEDLYRTNCLRHELC